jgi:AraC-like DNA-binding protein
MKGADSKTGPGRNAGNKCDSREDGPFRFEIELLGTDPHWRFPPHDGGARFIYQMGPSGVFRVKRRTYSLRPGDVLLVRDGEVIGRGEGEFIHVEFPPELFREGPDLFGRRGKRGRRAHAVAIQVAVDHREALENTIIALFRERDDNLPGRTAAIRGRILDLLLFSYRALVGTVPHWQQNESVTTMLYRIKVRHVIHYITSHLEEPFTLAGLAEMAGLNRTTFSRIHKTITGRSPMRFVEEQRMMRAGKLLAETAMPVWGIAERLGYRDPSTFFRAFRRHHRTTPQAFREEARGRSETAEHRGTRTDMD